MRIIALGALAIAITGLLASGTAAVDPPPGVDEPAATQGYTGFDATTVCGSAHLSAADKTECRLDMNAAKDDTARVAIQKRYDDRGALPMVKPQPSSEFNPPQPLDNPTSP